MYKREVLVANVGDVVYDKNRSYWQFAPQYSTFTVAKITPTGKLRLNSGDLIDPTRTCLKLLTLEIVQEMLDWELKSILVDTLKVLGDANNRAYESLDAPQVINLMDSLIPLLGNVEDNAQHNGSYVNSIVSKLDGKYKATLDDWNKHRMKMEGDK